MKNVLLALGCDDILLASLFDSVLSSLSPLLTGCFWVSNEGAVDLNAIARS
jgi:hypothetical protein